MGQIRFSLHGMAVPQDILHDGVAWFPNDTPATVQQAAPVKSKRKKTAHTVKARAARKAKFVAKMNSTLFADDIENRAHAKKLLDREIQLTAVAAEAAAAAKAKGGK